MRGEVERDSASLSGYLRVLRRRKWIILACALVVPATAYYFSARQPAQYQSSAQVYLSSQDLAGALTGISSPWVDEVRLADTQASLAHTPAVAEDAIELAGVDGITPGELLGSTSIVPQMGTNILTFTVTNGDSELAPKLATAYANAFTKYRGQLDSDAVRRARTELQNRLETLEAGGEGKSSLATSLRDKDQQLATLEALQTSRTYVIRTASGAGQIAPQPRRDAMLGLVLGLVLGIGIALAVEALDTRVRSAEEVGEYLRMPQVGRIPPPVKKLRKADQLLMLAQPKSAEAEAFRVLRINLEFVCLGADHDIKSILVTSAVEQEGKSTVAANLAVAVARSGKRACLVDLDLRRPYLDRFFDLGSASGLTDVALGRVTLDEALIEIDLATGLRVDTLAPRGASLVANGSPGRLDVLVSGLLPPDPGEFVGTRKLTDILMELRGRYDVVVIDSPPLLRVGDAMTLSARVDGLMVLTRLNVVNRSMLRELRQMLDAVPAMKLGYVATGSHRDAGYSGGYGYGYGYGHDERYARGREERVGRSATVSSNGRGGAREEETV